jgi:hypothetical protein
MDEAECFLTKTSSSIMALISLPIHFNVEFAHVIMVFKGRNCKHPVALHCVGILGEAACFAHVSLIHCASDSYS